MADQRACVARQHLIVQHAGRPVSSMTAIGNERMDDARLGAGFLRQSCDGRQVAFQVAAGLLVLTMKLREKPR